MLSFFRVALLFALFVAPAGAQVIPSGPVGSLNYWGVGGLSQVLNPGLAGQCLTTQGVGSAPVWVNCQVSSLSLLPSINTNQFYGNVSGQFAPPVGVDVNTILNTVGYDIARPPPVESIIYKSNVGPLFNWQALFPGTTGQILTSGGPTNPPFWSPSPTQSNLASICQTVGAFLYFDTPSLLWKCLNPGTPGQVLETGGPGANPSWLSGMALTSTNDTNVTATLGGTPATSVLQPVSITMGWTGTLAAGRLNSNVVQSFTNDTNVTASISAQNATLGWTGTLAIARGGTGAGTQQAALNNIAPTPTRAGDVIFWNGSNWVNLAGNNSGTQVLQETSAGVPSWAAPGTGTVTSVTCGTGLSGGTFTTTGTCAVSLSTATNSLGADVALSNTANYFDGPSVAQGTTGTWFASGTVTLLDTGATPANYNCKLWDGTTVIDSLAVAAGSAFTAAVSLSGFLASPAANIKISCKDITNTTGNIKFNSSGNSKDSTLSAFRIN